MITGGCYPRVVYNPHWYSVFCGIAVHTIRGPCFCAQDPTVCLPLRPTFCSTQQHQLFPGGDTVLDGAGDCGDDGHYDSLRRVVCGVHYHRAARGEATIFRPAAGKLGRQDTAAGQAASRSGILHREGDEKAKGGNAREAHRDERRYRNVTKYMATADR